MPEKGAVIRYGWDVFIAVCATGTALMMPVGLVLQLGDEAFVAYANWLVTGAYVVDIGVRYRQAQQPAPPGSATRFWPCPMPPIRQ